MSGLWIVSSFFPWDKYAPISLFSSEVLKATPYILLARKLKLNISRVPHLFIKLKISDFMDEPVFNYNDNFQYLRFTADVCFVQSVTNVSSNSQLTARRESRTSFGFSKMLMRRKEGEQSRVLQPLHGNPTCDNESCYLLTLIC